MILEDLFTNMAAMRQMVPGLESNLTFADLNPSALTARKRVTDLIGTSLYASIISNKTTAPEPFQAMCMAIANFVARQHLVFDTISRRKDNIDVYKYELEEMERAYMDNYFSSMDTLMRLLSTGTQNGNQENSQENNQENNQNNQSSWEDTRLAKMVKNLPVQDAARFDELYPIDLSYLFFFRTVPLQREIYEDNLAGIYAKVAALPEGDDRTQLQNRLDRITARWTVALAMTRFDILEFPAVIKNLFSDSKASRSGQTVQQRLLQMSEDLIALCRSDLESLQMQLDSDSSLNISTRTSFNEPDDNIYLMP